MGVRSDVAVCVKSELLANMPEGVAEFISEYSSKTLTHPLGAMFIFNDIKWYYGEPHIDQVYNWFRQYNYEDYLIMEACHDCPDSDEANTGEWYDNPWSVSKNITVSLDYNDPCSRLESKSTDTENVSVS